MERRYFIKTDRIGIDNYLTMVALENGLQARLDGNDCEYCIDGNGVWKTLPAGELTEPINARHTLSFRANLKPTSEIGVGTFAVNRLFNLKGKILSMLYGDNGNNNLYLPDFAFRKLFLGNDKLVRAEDLVLPDTDTQKAQCYLGMFKDCTSLISAPKLPALKVGPNSYSSMFENCISLITTPQLPATILGIYCYSCMFKGCISLKEASQLPATTVNSACYHEMFNGCTSLIKAPELSATTLVQICYGFMFNNCTSLNYIKMLATDFSGTDCLLNWVTNVAKTGTFVKASGVEIPIGDQGIPSGWTVIEE